jgi:hypothetical protein
MKPLLSTHGLRASHGISERENEVNPGMYEVEVWGNDAEHPLNKAIRASKSAAKNCHWTDAASRAAQFLCRLPTATKVQIRDGTSPSSLTVYITYIKQDGVWMVESK